MRARLHRMRQQKARIKQNKNNRQLVEDGVKKRWCPVGSLSKKLHQKGKTNGTGLRLSRGAGRSRRS
jgi:hypothetical protein